MPSTLFQDFFVIYDFVSQQKTEGMISRCCASRTVEWCFTAPSLVVCGKDQSRVPNPLKMNHGI